MSEQCANCGGLIKQSKENVFGWEMDIWVHLTPYWPDNHKMCAPLFAVPKRS